MQIRLVFGVGSHREKPADLRREIIYKHREAKREELFFYEYQNQYRHKRAHRRNSGDIQHAPREKREKAVGKAHSEAFRVKRGEREIHGRGKYSKAHKENNRRVKRVSKRFRNAVFRYLLAVNVEIIRTVVEPFVVKVRNGGHGNDNGQHYVKPEARIEIAQNILARINARFAAERLCGKLDKRRRGFVAVGHRVVREKAQQRHRYNAQECPCVYHSLKIS